MKRRIGFICCALVCALLVAFSREAMQAASEGFFLWRDAVLPALLPFFVCAQLMRGLGAGERGEWLLYALCLVCGAPGGARLAAAYEDTPARTRLAALLNLASPMFLYGTFCTGMAGVPLLALPILTGELLGTVFLLCCAKKPRATAQPREDPLRLFTDSVNSGVGAMLSIGETIILFKTLLCVLDRTGLPALLLYPLSRLSELLGLSGTLPALLLCGMAEMVNGCAALAASALPLRAIATLASFFLSFGGLCVLAQSLLFCRLDVGIYLKTKLLQGGLCAALTYAVFPLFRSVMAAFEPYPAEVIAQNACTALWVCACALLGTAVVALMSVAVRKKS